MINKKVNIILFIIFILSFFKTIITIINYENVDYEERKRVKGVILDIKKSKDKTVFDLKADKKYKITTYDSFNYKLGDKVFVDALFYPSNDNTVFNLFNYRKYLLSKNIELEGKLNSIKLIKQNNNLFYRFKNMLIDHIEDYKSKDYLKSFILADQSDIQSDIKESYQSLGISHLFAVSGMHISLFLLIINKIFKSFKYKNVIIITFFMLFLFITYYPVSLIRCFLFFVFNIINKKFKLGYSLCQIIIFIFFFMLFLNSYLIYNIGFLFSIIITFFIFLVSDKIKDYSYIKKSIVISIISFLASLPIIALSFFKINIISIICNVIFVPIVTYIMFPFSLITFIFPFLDDIYFLLIKCFHEFIMFIDGIDILKIVISKPNAIFLFLYYITLFLAIKFNKKIIVIYFIIFLININTRFFIINPEIIFLDVDQGDSSVILLPWGKCMVIDTGGISNYSISKKIIMPYLNSRGINKIDSLILTHGDYDHMGEAINLVENFKVEKVIFNCGEFNELENELISVLDKKKIPYYSCIKELNIYNNKLYFLNNKDYSNENDDSNVIYTEFDGIKLLLMGDAGVEVEEDILGKYNLNDIDVLKVGHHGSRTSSSEEFIDEIKPRYSIISVGKNNRYGHPNDSILDNLKNSKIYRTDQDGSIMFKIKNDELKIKTCAP